MRKIILASAFLFLFVSTAFGTSISDVSSIIFMDTLTFSGVSVQLGTVSIGNNWAVGTSEQWVNTDELVVQSSAQTTTPNTYDDSLGTLPIKIPYTALDSGLLSISVYYELTMALSTTANGEESSGYTYASIRSYFREGIQSWGSTGMSIQYSTYPEHALAGAIIVPGATDGRNQNYSWTGILSDGWNVTAGNQYTLTLSAGNIASTEYSTVGLPEPTTILLLCSGLVGVGIIRKKMKNKIM